MSVIDIGMTYLATYINERTEHKANIVDFTYRGDWRKHLKKNMETFNPDVIGISTVDVHAVYEKDSPEIKAKYGLPIISRIPPDAVPEDAISLKSRRHMHRRRRVRAERIS